MNVRLPFDPCLNQGRWSVLCDATNIYSFIGAGRPFCERKAPRAQCPG